MLAALEARAVAEDPQLAARLRGSGRWRLQAVHLELPRLPAPLRSRWWGVPLALTGLLLAMLAVATSAAVAGAGAVMAAAGLYLLLGMLSDRLAKSSKEAGASG